MQPRVRIILGTVFFTASGIAAVFGLTLGFRHPPQDGEYEAGQPLNLPRARRLVDDLHGYRSDAASPRVLDAQTSSPPFVSSYRNYTNATVTTDTNICSNVGMYVT